MCQCWAQVIFSEVCLSITDAFSSTKSSVFAWLPCVSWTLKIENKTGKIQRECQHCRQEPCESKAMKLHECSGCGFLVALYLEMQPRGRQGVGVAGCII